MPILSELRRRKVFQSVGLYLAAAWLALEVGEVVTELWEAPTWVLRALFVVLLAGVPVVFVVSWMYDLRGAGLVATDAPAQRSSMRLVALATLLLGGVLLLAAYLWPDDPLSEDVLRLRETTPAIELDSRALGYGLYGLRAPSGTDFWQYGRFLATTYNALGVLPEDPPDALHLTVTRDDLCRLRAPDCWPSFVADARGIAPLVEANAEALGRYRALRGARSHGNVIHIHWRSPVPAYSDLLLAQSIVLRELWRHDDATAVAALVDELAFYRVLLAESENVLGKMIAVALMEEGVRVYARLVSRGAALPPLARLSRAELSLVGPLRWEAVAAITAGDRERSALSSELFARPVDRILFQVVPYQPQRTLNAVVDPIVKAAAASTLTAAELQLRRDEFVASGLATDEWLVNAGGAYLLQGAPDFLSYVERVHDLDALIVLAQVVHAAVDSGVDAASIGPFLLALPRELRHPADGRPPVWADGEVSFIGGLSGRLPARLPLPLDGHE